MQLSRCHILFSSCCSPPSHEIESTSLPRVASTKRKKKKKPAVPKKTRPHTGTRSLRGHNNSQMRPSCTCARGQGHPSKGFREIFARLVVEMPSPFATNSPRRASTYWLAIWHQQQNSETVQRQATTTYPNRPFLPLHFIRS
jgi:hypothetical protein